MLENLMTMQEVLSSLKISRSSLYRLIGEGLPHVKIGGLKFDPVAVEKWIFEHRSSGRVNTSRPVETLKNSPRIRPKQNLVEAIDTDSESQARGNEYRKAVLSKVEKVAGRHHLTFKCDDGSIAKPIAKENTPSMKYLLSNPKKGDRIKLRGWLKQGKFVVTDFLPV